jgi:hypothetical protein
MLMGEAAEKQDPVKLKAASNTRLEEHFIIVLKMLSVVLIAPRLLAAVLNCQGGI